MYLRDKKRQQRSLVHALDADGEVLCHVAGLDGLDADGLERLRELDQRRVVVQLAAVQQPARPREDGRCGTTRETSRLLRKTQRPREDGR